MYRVTTDWRIVLVSVTLAILSALAFGLAPALQSVRQVPRGIRTRQVLVAVQVAASCVLLILTSVITRFVVSSLTIDARFDYNRMVIVNLYRANLKGAPMHQTLAEIAARAERLPGVDSVTSASVPPLGFLAHMLHLPNLPPVYLNDVAPSYFDAMAIPLVEGGTFRPSEQDAVIVSESAAKARWGSEDPLGKLWDLNEGEPKDRPKPQGPYTVVGVVKDSGANAIRDRNSVEAYVPLSDRTLNPEILIVHTNGDPSTLLRDVHGIQVRPGLHPVAYRMRRPMDQQTNALRNIALIVGALGGTATLLATIGIFGLLAFAVARRTQEIGVRVALGARPPDILRLLGRQYTVPLVVGAAAGVAMAAAAGKIMQSQGPLPADLCLDPPIYVLGVAIFAVVVAAAAIAPAVRALRINPATALRWE